MTLEALAWVIGIVIGVGGAVLATFIAKSEVEESIHAHIHQPHQNRT